MSDDPTQNGFGRGDQSLFPRYQVATPWTRPLLRESRRPLGKLAHPRQLPTQAAPPKASEPEQTSELRTWIEIQLVDKDGIGVGGELYQIELPDRTLRKGNLDGDGRARVDGIDPGNCKVSFPRLHADDWQRA